MWMAIRRGLYHQKNIILKKNRSQPRNDKKKMWKFFISIIDDARLLSFLCILWTTLLTLKKTPKVPSSDAHWEPFFGKYFHPWLTIIKTTENVTDFQLNACSIKKKKRFTPHNGENRGTASKSYSSFFFVVISPWYTRGVFTMRTRCR